MAITKDQFLAMPGARQHSPGVFTNDAGEFYDDQGNQIAAPGGPTDPITVQTTDTPPGWDANHPVDPNYVDPGAPAPTPEQPAAPAGPTGPTSPTTTVSAGGPTPNLPSAPGAPAPFSTPKFSYEDFKPRGFDELVNDPRYKFQLGQGLGAIGHKAAALGTLNTGGTIGDYVGFAENLANNSARDWYAQDLQTYDTNRAGAFEAWKANNGVDKDVYDTNYKTQITDPFAFGNTLGMERYGADATNYASGINQSQFDKTLSQNQGQFAATLAQQDKLAQQQFGLSYAQLDAQKKQQIDALAQNQRQFDTSTNQNDRQFNSTMDFNKWLEDYKRSVLDPFDQKYKTLGLL